MLAGTLICSFLISTAFAAAPNTLRGTFSKLRGSDEAAVVYISVSTTEGIERFRFTPSLFNRRFESASSGVERHYQGFSTRIPLKKAGRFFSPASLSIVGSEVRAYFFSRRHARLVALKFELEKELSRESFVSGSSEIYRGSQGLPCGTEESGLVPSSKASFAVAKAVSISPGLTVSPGLADEGEANQPSSILPFVPPRVIKIATDADYEFYGLKGSNSKSYIRTILNAIEALYMAQLGLRFQLTTQHVYTQPGTIIGTSADEVLESFRLSSLANDVLGEADVHHLFSGKNFLGSTIGLAYLGTTCTSNGIFNFGISQKVNESLQPLLTAHEIAHNLNATHDPTLGSIMNLSLTTDDSSFLPRSLNEIASFVLSTGSCLTKGPLRDVNLTTSLSTSNIFKATAVVSSGDSQGCTVRLYGAPLRSAFIKSKDAGKTLLTLKRVIVSGGYSPQVVQFETSAPRSPFGATSFFFKTTLSCPSGSAAASKVTSVSYPTAAANSRLSASGWIHELAKKLKSSDK